MSVQNAIMVPHPPLIIPQVGRGEEKTIEATTLAYRAASRFVANSRPELLVITTPHSVMYADWFHISPGAGAKGSLSQFGAGEPRLNVRYDTEFIKELCTAAKKEGFPAGTQGEKSAELDHASFIPLCFLKEAYGDEELPPVVRIGLSGLSLAEHYRLGMLIRSTAKKLNRRVSVIASGDLSHRLKADGPYGFKAEGPQYDERIMDVMGRAAFGELLEFPEAFCEDAGECGHRSFTIMAGCFDGLAVKAERLSYEGVTGVGYGVCTFACGEADEARRFLAAQLERESERLRAKRAAEDEYVRLARLSVETFVKTGKRAPLPEGLAQELTSRRAGAFVSLHENGQLRGCIGTISPATGSVAEEILQNGVSACSEDPRFSPVAPEELPYLEYSVDVLGDAESINSPAQLDVKKYGVIVTSGRRRGLLLPDLDGVDTAEEQVAIARRKAGIAPGEKISLERFEVVRHV